MKKYNIPSHDKELVRGCFEAAEEVLAHLRTHPPETRVATFKVEDAPAYRIALAQMFLQLDIEARRD
ncbi:hypothetical protein K4F84_02965 [Phaeobacter inhibens]|uniref:hypothetical protein n=1 Tax=Phaeobacter inhibens TaxID=221822 RepID=UPI0021A266DD|nr:hypothetical protein [Phaeobacter inhibens]UWR53593.1 hypothetical protein K4F84_02965 [Phaeobacter inhibens]